MNLSLNLGNSPSNSEPGTRNHAIARSGALSPAQAWLRGDDSCATPLLVSPYQQSVWVYTAVSALAQTISSIPFRISRGDRSGENLVTHGSVVDLFNRPHPTLNRFRFLGIDRHLVLSARRDLPRRTGPIRHRPAHQAPLPLLLGRICGRSLGARQILLRPGW